MTVHLLEKTPVGVTTKSLDIRHGKSVEDVADEAKARFVGEAIADWWLHAGRHHFVRFHLGFSVPLVFDLRANLILALRDGFRISPACRDLLINDDGTSRLRDGWCPKVIGQDVISWWADPQGAHLTIIEGLAKTVRYDLRLGLNQSMANWQEELRRAETKA